MVFPADRKSARPTAFTLMVRAGWPGVVVGIPLVLKLVLAATVVCGTRVLAKIPAEVVGLGG